MSILAMFFYCSTIYCLWRWGLVTAPQTRAFRNRLLSLCTYMVMHLCFRILLVGARDEYANKIHGIFIASNFLMVSQGLFDSLVLGRLWTASTSSSSRWWWCGCGTQPIRRQISDTRIRLGQSDATALSHDSKCDMLSILSPSPPPGFPFPPNYSFNKSAFSTTTSPPALPFPLNYHFSKSAFSMRSGFSMHSDANHNSYLAYEDNKDYEHVLRTAAVIHCMMEDGIDVDGEAKSDVEVGALLVML